MYERNCASIVFNFFVHEKLVRLVETDIMQSAYDIKIPRRNHLKFGTCSEEHYILFVFCTVYCNIII